MLKAYQIIEEIEKLKKEFSENLIYPIDLNLGNMLLQKTSSNSHRLILIDGYGITNKFPAIYISKGLGRKQIERKFTRQIALLNNEYERPLLVEQ